MLLSHHIAKTFLIVSIVFISLFGNSYSAQKEGAKNTAYIEFLGKGFYYSLNYERVLVQFNDQLGIQASWGFGLYPGTTNIEKSTDFTMPIELNVRYSFVKHHAVIGYGTTLWKYKLPEIPISNSNIDQQPIQPTLKNVKEWFAHMVFEYRYQKPEGGLMLKVGYTPLFFAQDPVFAYTKKVNYATSFNLGVGYSF